MATGASKNRHILADNLQIPSSCATPWERVILRRKGNTQGERVIPLAPVSTLPLRWLFFHPFVKNNHKGITPLIRTPAGKPSRSLANSRSESFVPPSKPMMFLGLTSPWTNFDVFRE